MKQEKIEITIDEKPLKKLQHCLKSQKARIKSMECVEGETATTFTVTFNTGEQIDFKVSSTSENAFVALFALGQCLLNNKSH